jgi:probable F420-dependent oxidoreductase
MPFPDPLLPLAFAAAVTKRIKFSTNVIILPHHHPLHLAKQLATLDVLSKGRMRVGIGSGWLKEEFEALGLDFSTRGARTDETIQAMRVLWRENPSSFRGKHISFEPVKSFPKPVQKNGIPIYIGGNSIPAIRRAARYGDGFIPTPQEDITPLIKLLRQECDKIGRNINEIDIIWGFYSAPSEDQLKRADDLGIKAIGSGIQFTNDLDAITRDLETLANKLVAR